jgi:hypothetical protein
VAVAKKFQNKKTLTKSCSIKLLMSLIVCNFIFLAFASASLTSAAEMGLADACEL